MAHTPNLPAYFARIGCTLARTPTLAALQALCEHHLRAIPFDGLNPFLGLGVDLDPLAIQHKLLHANRGGYCHEQNSLFHDVLAALDFRVTALGARVVYTNPGAAAPMTHRFTLVDLPEGRFLADVGFGGNSPTAPLRLHPGLVQSTPHGTFRIMRHGDGYGLELQTGTDWTAMYLFTLAPPDPVDFEVANWYTATHPRSPFTQNLVVCRVIGASRVNLRSTDLITRPPDGRAEHRALRSSDELREVLEEVMGLTLPVPVERIWKKLAPIA